MSNQSKHSLENQANGGLAIDLFKFEENCFSDQVQRNNYFSIIWIKEGFGKVKTGFSEFDFKGNSLLTFAPNQPYLFAAEKRLKGVVMNFNSEFIFVQQQKEGSVLREILYNNIYKSPLVQIDNNSIAAFDTLCENIEREIKNTSPAQHDLLVAYLMIFSISASRLKMEQETQWVFNLNDNKEHYMLQKLRDFIENNYKAKHSPCDYAAMLCVTPKTLGKVSKSYYNKTISSIINERIIIEAKRELHLTNKAIKEIAYELGYEDEHYFSRFFRVNTKLSPQKYRETVGYANV